MDNKIAWSRNPRFADFNGRSFTAEELELIADSPSLVRLDFKNCAIGDDEIELLCHLPRLQSMWLEGTRVTDAALVHLARLPKLDWLVLDHTAVTGSGLSAFRAHPSLRTLSMRNTAMTDLTMPLVAAITRLSVIHLGGTMITEAGLMALAAHPTARIGGQHAFEDDIVFRFEDLQRQLASRTPPGFQSIQADEDEARAVLLGFMSAITQWERDMASTEHQPGDWKVEQVRAAFDQYCTAKDRKYGGPNALSFGTPPTYESTTIFATEWINPRNVLFYTRDVQGSRERFALVKKSGRWLLDHKQQLGNGWEMAFL
jgi:hypothetical protein